MISSPPTIPTEMDPGTAARSPIEAMTAVMASEPTSEATERIDPITETINVASDATVNEYTDNGISEAGPN